MKEITISIVVPIYNVSVYLEKCINSIIRQSYKNLEIILVNDGSTDRSGEICDDYEKQDHRIRVIHQKNMGLVVARKTGLKYASGEYLIFVDGDDYIESNLCEEMLKRILELDVDFVHADYIENDDKRINNIKYPEVLADKDLLLKDRLELIKRNVFDAADGKNEKENFLLPSIWAKIYKTSFVKKWYDMVPESSSYGEDLIFLCVAILSCSSMAMISDAYYHYNLRENSLSHERSLDNIVKMSGLYMNLKHIFKEYNCWEQVSEAVKGYYEYCIFFALKLLESGTFHVNRYYFNKIEKLFGKRILLYGAGNVGRDYYDQICRYEDITIVGWIDKNHKHKMIEYCNVSDPKTIKKEEFDLILIAIRDERIKNEICSDLTNLGVDKSKILWDVPLENQLS